MTITKTLGEKFLESFLDVDVLYEKLDKAEHPERIAQFLLPLLNTAAPSQPSPKKQKISPVLDKDVETLLRGLKRYMKGFSIEDDRKLMRGEQVARFSSKQCTERRRKLREHGLDVPYVAAFNRNNNILDDAPEFGSAGEIHASLGELDKEMSNV